MPPGGGDGFGSGYDPLATADANCNLLAKDVIGNKADSASTGAVCCVDSLMGYTKQIVTAITGAGGICKVVVPLGPFGDAIVQDGVDSSGTYTVHLVNLNGDVLTNCETTPGTFDVVRVRAGCSCQILTAQVATESNGIITGTIDFTAACPDCWAGGDVGYIEFNNITATVCCVVSTFPVLRKYFRITQEEDIEAKIDVIDAFHDVATANAACNLAISDIVGNKADCAATGAVSCVESIMAYSKQTIGRLAVPGVDVACNISIAQTIGGKADTSSFVGVCTDSLMSYVKGILGTAIIACGTFTTSSATVPADTGRTEATGWFNGSLIMPLTGAVAFQPRVIACHDSIGDVFTIDDDAPFTAATGLVTYVILRNIEPIIATANATTNTMPYHVIGNKADCAAVGSPSCCESLMAYAKEIQLGIGFDGVTCYASGFNEDTAAGVLHGQHGDVSILFVIPEAVGSISCHNTAIRVELQQQGHVDTITQSMALDHPHFGEYNIVVLGTDNGSCPVWCAANLVNVQQFPEGVLVFDVVAAVAMLMGTDGGDAACKTVMNGITQIEAIDVGIGLTGLTGANSGANTVSSAATYNTLIMSDAQLTETFYGYETCNANTDVLLGVVYKRQPDGTRGILTDGAETPGDRWFYGPGYSANCLVTLGQDILQIIVHMALQATTAGATFEISGDIGDLETKIFGNQASCFNNGGPLVEWLAGRNSTGTANPVGKSLYDVMGDTYLDACGGLGTDTIAADLALIHAQNVIIDEFMDVPAANNTLNAQMNEVIGQKCDSAAAGAVTTCDTIVGYIKQLVTASELTGSATAIGKNQVAAGTIDLHQCAGSFDLFTGTTQDFMLTGFSFKMPNIDASDDACLTGITIQTDDVTAQVIICSCTGLKANLTAEAELSWTGRIKITTATKIQLTIVGGTAACDPTTALTTADGFAIVAGGNLA